MDNEYDEAYQEILIRHLRSHRDQLESTHALQVRATKQYKVEAEKLMKRLEQMKEVLIRLLNFARKTHVGCSGKKDLSKCETCFAYEKGREIVGDFRY